MIITLLALLTMIFLCIRFIISAYNLSSKPYVTRTDMVIPATISILIPARNEAHNIGRLLDTLIKMDLFNLIEILVLNDHSTDQTASIVDQYALQDSRVRRIDGKALPSGWLGKNYACHQLALQAQGEIFLFLDADLMPTPQAIVSAVYALKKSQLALYSIFPDQYIHTLGEKLVVPLMHYLLASLLPLRWVFTKKNPAFAAANGQFMCFDASIYKIYMWHQRVKHSILDDVYIMREIKKLGLKGQVVCAGDTVHCRMYAHFTEAYRGFSKNLFLGFGNNILGMSAYFFLISIGYVFIYLAWGIPAFCVACILAVLIRWNISRLANQSVLYNVLLHPLQILLFIAIGYTSAYLTFTRNMTWKGRNIQI